MSYSKHPIQAEERLALLLHELWIGNNVSPDLRAWLLKAFVHYLHHGGSIPLDRFLGLSPINAGERSLSTRLRHLKRDMLLIEALDKIALHNEVSNWMRCVRLAKELDAFEAHTWPLYRYHQLPPTDWPEWKQSLLLAFQVGIGIPRSARALFGIQKRARDDSFHSGSIKLLTSLTMIKNDEKDLVHN